MTEDLPGDALERARASEDVLRDKAAEIRGDAERINAAMFDRLLPLAREPIPAGFIVQAPAVKGKPYESTGVRSVQVLIDRMNNVFGPRWWWDEVDYLNDDGTLCHVQVCVGNRPSVIIVDGTTPVRGAEIVASAQSWGGVNQGSTKGNIYKGSYTNAAKRAFAALGPGHEVYLGDADMDPDTNPDVAAAGDDAKPPPTIGKAKAKTIVDAAWQLKQTKEKLQLAAMHVVKGDVGDCSTKAKATDALAKLTPSQAEKVEAWIIDKAREATT